MPRFITTVLCALAALGVTRTIRAQAPPPSAKPAPDAAESDFEGRAAPPTAAGTTALALEVHPGLEVFAQYAYRRTEHQGGGASWYHELDVPRIHLALEAKADSARGRVVVEGVRSAAEGALIGSIAPKGFLLIVADKVGAPSSPQTDCLGASTCFHVSFGISGSAGDQVFLLKGKEVQASGEIPANAHAAGESWCRDPDGNGAFVKCSPTPATTNKKL